jgi:hypothetical protein
MGMTHSRTTGPGDLAERDRQYADVCRAYNRALHARDLAERRVAETHRAMLSAAATFFEGAEHG